MSEPIQTNQMGTQRSQGAKFLGVVLIVIGFILFSAIVFPYVGTIVAVIGLMIGFTGFGLYAYGSKVIRSG